MNQVSYQAQKDLETTMIQRGHERYKRRQEKLQASQQEAPHDLISNALTKVSQAITKTIAEEETRVKSGLGKPSVWHEELKGQNTDTLAYLGLNICYDSVIYSQTLTSALANIGKMIERERWAIDLKSHDKVLFKRLVAQVSKDHNSVPHRAKAGRIIADKEGFSRNKWSKKLKISLGSPILNAILDATDIFEIVTTNQDLKTMRHLCLTPEAEGMIRDFAFDASWAEPLFGPLVVPPKPWTSFTTGVYNDEVLAALTPLVRRATGDQRRAIEREFEKGEPQFVTALNALQATPLAVNKDIVDVIKYVRDEKLEYHKFPSLDPPKYPEISKDVKDVTEDMLSQLRKDRKAWFITKRECLSNFSVLQEDLKTADYLSDFDQFWIGWSFDYRGRMYSVSHWNYHRADHIKACFLSGNPKKLDDDSRGWLMIHLANVGDFDKISKKSLNDRIDWVLENEKMILDIASDWKGSFDTWSNADAPMQFLAACFEYKKMKEQGDDYMCSLFCSLDGTNSGTQHLALASRDKDDAQKVNLVPGDECADVYQLIADAVVKRLELDYTPEAKRWLDYGVNRSTVKRNAMCYGYSSLPRGMADQIIEDLMDPLQKQVNYNKLEKHPFGDYKQQSYHARYLAQINYECISETLSSVSKGMSFLQSYAHALAREGKSVRWTSPSGFPAVQKYTKDKPDRVRIFLYDRAAKERRETRINIQVDTNTADSRKAKAGIAANFVHSLDSAHMTLSILRGVENGITDYFMIHDSFGTLPSDTWKFWHCIRMTLVEMYDDNCVFSNYEQECRDRLNAANMPLMPVPPKGDLKVSDVVHSEYCFS